MTEQFCNEDPKESVNSLSYKTKEIQHALDKVTKEVSELFPDKLLYEARGIGAQIKTCIERKIYQYTVPITTASPIITTVQDLTTFTTKTTKVVPVPDFIYDELTRPPASPPSLPLVNSNEEPTPP